VNKEQTLRALSDYRWMLNEIERLRKDLNDDVAASIGKYGEESSLPKANKISDPVGSEVIRRERKSRFHDKIEKKVKFITNRLHVITDDREQAVLYCVIDGMSNIKIAKHMGLSESHIRNIKESIAEKMCEECEDYENCDMLNQHIDMA
jgi:DNA-binding NarL/FixJ family response regulator